MSYRRVCLTGRTIGQQHMIQLNGRPVLLSSVALPKFVELCLAKKRDDRSSVEMTPQLARVIRDRIGADLLAGHGTCFALDGEWRIDVEDRFYPVADDLLSSKLANELRMAFPKQEPLLTRLLSMLRQDMPIVQACTVGLVVLGTLVGAVLGVPSVLSGLAEPKIVESKTEHFYHYGEGRNEVEIQRTRSPELQPVKAVDLQPVRNEIPAHHKVGREIRVPPPHHQSTSQTATDAVEQPDTN